MVKKSDNGETEPISLEWTWRPEELDKTVVHGKGQVSARQLLDQKVMNDVSDYLWYMTRFVNIFIYFISLVIYISKSTIHDSTFANCSVDLKKKDIIWSHNMSLRVNGSGHVLHAYINGKYIGMSIIILLSFD